MAKTKEPHFEDVIEHHLLTSGGWTKGNRADFDRRTGLVPTALFAFIASTPPELWAHLRKYDQSAPRSAVLDALVKVLSVRGSLEALPHNVKYLRTSLDLPNSDETT
jgi:type I restriction enzyme, R subunit